jgi:predicted ABC-type ATPase
MQSSNTSSKRILILAGPNGAGKTTFAKEFLPNEANCLTFINADLIAAGLSPFEPEKSAIQAGKLMLRTIDRQIREKKSFAFETTLSGKGYARKIPTWRNYGYHVDLFFLSLLSPEVAMERVASRVSQGGHNIPAEVIQRRFVAGLNNFNNIYKPIVNTWQYYDNNGTIPILIDHGENA